MAWWDVASPWCWLSRWDGLPKNLLDLAEPSQRRTLHPRGCFRLEDVTSLTTATSVLRMTLVRLHQHSLGGTQMSPIHAGLLHGGPMAKPPPISALPGGETKFRTALDITLCLAQATERMQTPACPIAKASYHAVLEANRTLSVHHFPRHLRRCPKLPAPSRSPSSPPWRCVAQTLEPQKY